MSNKSTNNFYHMKDVCQMLEINYETMKGYMATAKSYTEFEPIMPDLYTAIVNISGRWLMPKKALHAYIERGTKPKRRGRPKDDVRLETTNWNFPVAKEINHTVNIMLRNANRQRLRQGGQKINKVAFQNAMIVEFIQNHSELLEDND